MKKIILGHTNQMVSAIALGTDRFGTRVDKVTSMNMLDTYTEAGGSFIDTANSYSIWHDGTGDESELIIGEWMQKKKNRKDIFLATKCGARTDDFSNFPESIEGLSAKAIREAVNGSLKRLGIDAIDLLYAHVDDRLTPLEETLKTFDDLIRKGKVRYIGCSNMQSWRLALAVRISEERNLHKYCCIQQCHSYLTPLCIAHSYAQDLRVQCDLMDYCKYNNFPIIAYSPLLGGAYCRQDKSFPPEYRHPDSGAQLKALNKVSRQAGSTINQLILAWMLHSKLTVIPIIGGSKVSQISENLKALAINLSGEQMDFLNKARGL